MFDIMNEPIFCITSDIDWASPFCVKTMLKLFGDLGIIPTLFASHNCSITKEFSRKHPNNVGIHPNFSFGFAQNECPLIIDRLLGFYPEAKFSRSHAYCDSTYILLELRKRGIQYDSNLLLYLQPNIRPLYLKLVDIVRFPVFWEDSAHRYIPKFGWKFSNVRKFFMVPGLKIVGIHPFLIAANVASEEYYQQVKNLTPIFSNEDDVWKGEGPKSFLLEFVDFVKSQGLRFYSFYELYRAYQRGEF